MKKDKIIIMNLTYTESNRYPSPGEYVKLYVGDVLDALDDYVIPREVKSLLQVYSDNKVNRDNVVIGKVSENFEYKNKQYVKVKFTNIASENERLYLEFRDVGVTVIDPVLKEEDTDIIISTKTLNPEVMDLIVDYSIIVGGSPSSIEESFLKNNPYTNQQSEEYISQPLTDLNVSADKNGMKPKDIEVMVKEFLESLSESNKISNFDSHNHCMIDIETLSTEVNTVITEVSLVRFNPKTSEIFESIKVNISIQDSLDNGFEVSESTLNFWFNQDKNVNYAVNFDPKDRVNVYTGLELITEFLTVNFDEPPIMWGNGPSFDLAKLKHHYNKFYLESPWYFYNERCVRTICSIDKELTKSIKFIGDKHDSYYDCLHQIKQISAVINKYNL